MSLSYEELVLGLVVNADTLEGDEDGSIGRFGRPFNCEQLGQFDFRLEPTSLRPAYETTRKSLHVFELAEIQSWWNKGLALSLDPLAAVEEKLRFDPFKDSLKVATDFETEYRPQIESLRAFGLDFRPVAVEGDGSCLVHAVSVATMGCHVYYDALRYALYHELCTHRAYYTRTGRIDEGFGARFRGRLLQDRDTAVMLGLRDRAEGADEALYALDHITPDYGGALYSAEEVEAAIERARPCEGKRLGQDRFLEDIHLTAMANVLKRPLWVMADSLRVFLPLRHDPEEVRVHGVAPRPLVLAHALGHYVPLCLNLREDYWDWLKQLFPDNIAIHEAFKMYGDVLDFDEDKRCIPEWAEDVLYYIVRKAWQQLILALDEQDVCEVDKHDFLRLFGQPKELLEVGAWIFEGLGYRELAATFRHEPVLLRLYEGLGFQVVPLDDRHRGYVKLRLQPHMLDIALVKQVVTALYAFRSLPRQGVAPTNRGIVPIQGRRDAEVCGKVSNGVMSQAIDWGLARLYCEPNGWRFYDPADPEAIHRSRPSLKMAAEKRRLIAKFESLTGLAFETQVARDLAEHHCARRSDDLRSQLPEALMAMQRVLSTRPYPGRAPPPPRPILLHNYPPSCPLSPSLPSAPTHRRLPESSLSSSTSSLSSSSSRRLLYAFESATTPPPFATPDADEEATSAVRLSALPLETVAQRRRLLRALVSHYGLAARGPGFEKAAAAVAMPELADEADARSRFAEWIATTAEQPTGEVVLTPLDPPCPLPRLGILRIRDEEERDEGREREDQPPPLRKPEPRKAQPRKAEPRKAEPPAYKDEAKPLPHRQESERGAYQDDVKAPSNREESARGASQEDAKANYSLQGPIRPEPAYHRQEAMDSLPTPAYARQDSLGSSSSTSSWSRQDSLASSTSSVREEDEAVLAHWGAHPPRKQGSTSSNVRTALSRIKRGPQPF